jgi:glycerol uptake facilitator-like aquaporin
VISSAAVVWGYAPIGIAVNPARDVSGRLAAITIWGIQAAGSNYAALAALTSFPATVLAGAFYEFFLCDSSRGEYLTR